MSRSLRNRVAFVLAVCAAPLLALPAPGADVPDIAGIYEVNGETTVEGSPDRFAITGKVIVRQNGTKATTIVEAAMRRAAGTSGPASAALLGNGEITIEGDRLTGSAELQSLVSEVPELDVAVPFAPRRAGPILDAKVVGKIASEGVLELHITSEVIGEGFTLPEGRKTVVVAKRVARKPTELKKKR
jgi:hypothetical protein